MYSIWERLRSSSSSCAACSRLPARPRTWPSPDTATGWRPDSSTAISLSAIARSSLRCCERAIPRINGVLVDRLPEVLDRPFERTARAPVPQVPPLEIELIRLAVRRGSTREPLLLGAVQRDPQSGDNLARNLLFDGRDVGQSTGELSTPQLAIGRRVQELGLDIQRVVALQDSTGQQDPHIQLAHRALRTD